MAYECRIIADSMSPRGVRLTTFVVTFPRIVLAEFNTHRMLSRNSASSRAIPVEKMIARVLDDPFVPVYWGKNQKGMQAEQELDEIEKAEALRRWLVARDRAVDSAYQLLANGVHKQIANRLLEPFLWHTAVATATDWSNFFNLRCHKDAQPEIRVFAEMMKSAYELRLDVRAVNYGEWHLPFVDPDEAFDLEGVDGLTKEQIAKISCARCSRVSYLNQDGVRDVKKDLEHVERLLGPGHMSPFEHAATPADGDQCFIGNFYGWVQYRKHVPNESDPLAGRSS